MKRIFALYKIPMIALAIIFIGGCEDYFEYSPYAANVKDSYKNLDEKNMNKLLSNNNETSEEIKFAVLADSHYDYHELDEALVNINSIEDIDFVLVNGDIADHGYLKEYELFHEKMKRLNMPYLTVIGNHDYRSNGIDIYTEMYGEPNKSFIFKNNLFVLFDDVFWESNKMPDMDWLEKELKYSNQYNNCFVFAHIPPYSDQFTKERGSNYEQLMDTYNVDLSIHGHVHEYIYDDNGIGETDYLAVESMKDKEFVIVTVTENSYSVKRVKY
ncbi:MAG: metallophosphoesterase [Bacteroidales bacterium]|nr:metallophosphoesterase [Bacteroidales bacterium]